MTLRAPGPGATWSRSAPRWATRRGGVSGRCESTGHRRSPTGRCQCVCPTAPADCVQTATCSCMRSAGVVPCQESLRRVFHRAVHEHRLEPLTVRVTTVMMAAREGSPTHRPGRRACRERTTSRNPGAASHTQAAAPCGVARCRRTCHGCRVDVCETVLQPRGEPSWIHAANSRR